MSRDIRDGLACERLVHDALKADHDRWTSETLPPPGHQVRPVFATVDDGWCEQAACVHCGGGITRRIDVKLHATCGALESLPPCYGCSLPAHHVERCRFRQVGGCAAWREPDAASRKENAVIDPCEWKWFGNAGHFIASSHCRFHLCTVVGKYLISTVGQYVPDAPVREILAQSRGVPLVGRGDAREADWMCKFGYQQIGCDRTYETMVFEAGAPCSAEGCGCGMPSQASSELDFDAYNDAKAATDGHMAMCRKYAIGVAQ